MLFLSASHYPQGGMSDFIGCYPTVEKAFLELNILLPKYTDPIYHIFDTETGLIVIAMDYFNIKKEIRYNITIDQLNNN